MPSGHDTDKAGDKCPGLVPGRITRAATQCKSRGLHRKDTKGAKKLSMSTFAFFAPSRWSRTAESFCRSQPRTSPQRREERKGIRPVALRALCAFAVGWMAEPFCCSQPRIRPQRREERKQEIRPAALRALCVFAVASSGRTVLLLDSGGFHRKGAKSAKNGSNALSFALFAPSRWSPL
jgi:hypothetical protein